MNLKIECLKNGPMSEGQIQQYYEKFIREGLSSHTILRIMLSHERLRAELAGAEVLLKESGVWKDGD